MEKLTLMFFGEDWLIITFKPKYFKPSKVSQFNKGLFFRDKRILQIKDLTKCLRDENIIFRENVFLDIFSIAIQSLLEKL